LKLLLLLLEEKVLHNCEHMVSQNNISVSNSSFSENYSVLTYFPEAKKNTAV